MTTETTEEKNISAEKNFSGQRDYWRQVGDSDGYLWTDYFDDVSWGFDVEDVSLPSYMNGMISGLMPHDCQDYYYPYRVLVQRYAKLGLHRYNMLEGTRFELASVLKFNKSQCYISSYYMTLLAHDQEPAASTLDKTFQVRVDEKEFGSLDLACSIARLKDEVTTEKKPFIPHFHGGAAADGIFKGELPEWPSDDDFNDGKRFYVVKESEWQATDWMSMYLELVVCTHDTSIMNRPWQADEIMSKLEIVNVAIETGIEDVEPSNERLKAKSANVYITYKGLAELQAFERVFEIGEHIERKAIVRRVIDEDTGYMTLVGKLCGGLITSCKKRAKLRGGLKSCKKRPRSG